MNHKEKFKETEMAFGTIVEDMEEATAVSAGRGDSPPLVQEQEERMNVD